MRFFRDERRVPPLQWLLLLTCLTLSGIIVAQQEVIQNQGTLIRLMWRDSTDLAQMRIEKAAQQRGEAQHNSER